MDDILLDLAACNVSLVERLAQIPSEFDMTWKQINVSLRSSEHVTPLASSVCLDLHRGKYIDHARQWDVPVKAAYGIDAHVLLILDSNLEVITPTALNPKSPGNYACDAIRHYITKHNISRTDLAKKLQTDYAKVCRPLRESSRLSWKSLENFSRALDLNWCYFVPKVVQNQQVA